MSDPQGYNGSIIDEDVFMEGVDRLNKKSQQLEVKRQFIPQPGNIVVLFFRNGVQLEGEVISWSNEKSILKSPTGSSTIVIQKTLDDIMFYRFNNSKIEYEKLKEKPRKEEVDIKDIAALKGEINDIERAEVREKLNSHSLGEMKEVEYGIPGNFKVKSVEQHTGAEGPRKNSNIGAELQGLFSKKH